MERVGRRLDRAVGRQSRLQVVLVDHARQLVVGVEQQDVAVEPEVHRVEHGDVGEQVVAGGAVDRDRDALAAPGLAEPQPELERAVATVDEHERGVGPAGVRRTHRMPSELGRAVVGGDRAARGGLGPHRGEAIALRARVVVEEMDREASPSPRRGQPPPVADRLERDRFRERPSPDDPEVDVVVGQRVPAHHVPQQTLGGVLPLVEEVDVGLLAAEPVTDEHVAPEELAEPEDRAHAAGSSPDGRHVRWRGRCPRSTSAAEATTVRPSTKSPIDQIRFDARAIPARSSVSAVRASPTTTGTPSERATGIAALPRSRSIATTRWPWAAEQGDRGGPDVAEPAHDHVTPRPVAGGHPVELVAEQAGGEADGGEQRHHGSEEAGDLERHRERLPRIGRRHEVQGEEEQRVVHRGRHRHAAGPEVADDTERERSDPDGDRGNGRARWPPRTPRSTQRLHGPSSYGGCGRGDAPEGFIVARVRFDYLHHTE